MLAQTEFSMCSRTVAAFTLIELLLVVMIIGLLAAIALPAYIEAQARAKVGRVQADLRSVALSLEQYHMDQEAYPSMIVPGFDGGPSVIAGSELMWWYVPNSLSTPLSYLSNAALHCPFGGNWDKAPYFPGEIWRRYGYENIAELIHKAETWPVFRNRYPPEAIHWSGSWRLQSVGPDRMWNPSLAYDPSNGTVSSGDMIRTQKSPIGNTQPDLLNHQQ